MRTWLTRWAWNRIFPDHPLPAPDDQYEYLVVPIRMSKSMLARTEDVEGVAALTASVAEKAARRAVYNRMSP